MKSIVNILKKDMVLTVSWILAVISMFFVVPNPAYIEYIDWRSLGILWSLMVITKGLSVNGFFEKIGHTLLSKTKYVWQLVVVLVMLCFLTSMLITNDVALITFVPFTIMMLSLCDRKDLMIMVIVLQTIAANLGSMLTPIGNPQNLYLYGLSGMSIQEFILLMLPFTLVSLVLLLISILFIKGKTKPIVSMGDIKKKSGSRIKVYLYGMLFFLALSVVARFLPYYVLVFAVLFAVILIDAGVILKVDYCLLLTFVGFFIFTGNIGKIEAVNSVLKDLVAGREVVVGVLASQFISNVPAALLLSDFTQNIKGLIVGVNIGGLGTMIASMASLISYKLYANVEDAAKGRYFVIFTLMNVIYLTVLLLFTFVIPFFR